MSNSKQITKEQWAIIEAPVKARMECQCKPICLTCKLAMYESQQIHTRFSRTSKMSYSTPSSSISRSLMWYEVTFTYPKRDNVKAKCSIEKLKKYSNYKYIDGRFEIGKNGLYHMHFLIKTNKYLRLREIKACNDNKVAHLARLKGTDGLKFQNYIEKDAKVEKPAGWDFNFSQ